ncbi:MAG: hypothetical protein IK031_00330 [Bacteroidales bacterium]|nr:hypothetical protein [Bacteroidales bacterium]
MRTRISYIALSALFALSLSGCVSEAFTSDRKGQAIVLNLYVEGAETKAPRNGNAALNENYIGNTIDIFFYDEDNLRVVKEVIGAIRSGTMVEIQTNPNELEDIFGTLGAGAKSGLFVVANFTGTYEGTAGSRTLTQIKNSVLPAPNWEALPQTSFVMTGDQLVSLGHAGGSTPVYANVGLERVAAKVTFEVTVAENASGDSSWTPVTDNMTVYMVYAMRKATLGADPVSMPATATATYAPGEPIVYSQYLDKPLYDTGTTRDRSRGSGQNVSVVASPVYSTTLNGAEKPFYTYPLTWETGSAMEPYMKLIIPWEYNNVTRKYYYKIPFLGNALERNHWYHISIDVQILGTEQADPPQVEIHYAIANWSGQMDTSTAENITSVTSVPATVITTRYLNIPTTEYVLFDQDQIIIPIQSSHDVEVKGFQMDGTNAYQPAHVDDQSNYIGTNVSVYNPYTDNLDLSSVQAVHPDYSTDPPTPVSSASGWTITVNERESITVSHTLNRTMADSNFDVAPYTLRFRVRHQSESDNYFVDVIVEQRPAIIIKPQRNSDNGTPNSKGHTTEDGYVFINGVRTTTDQSSNRKNTNFNMYIVETSVLPTDVGSALRNDVLGDPRATSAGVSYTTGLTADDFAQGTDIADGSTRRMENYYPAQEDEDHNVFIAPSFRIASSFGTSSSMTRAVALQRCATYQEDGYPAGRWRLPTRAEIEYMVTLSQKGKIPALFSAESDVRYGGYWCSAGAVFPLTDGTQAYKTYAEASAMTVYNSNGSTLGTGVHWARCVYDEWFWEDTQHEKASSKTVYTWGDEALNTVRKK